MTPAKVEDLQVGTRVRFISAEIPSFNVPENQTGTVTWIGAASMYGPVLTSVGVQWDNDVHWAVLLPQDVLEVIA